MPFSIMMIFTGLVTMSLLFFAMVPITVNNSFYFMKDNDHHSVPLLPLPGAALCLQKKPLLQVSIYYFLCSVENLISLDVKLTSQIWRALFALFYFWQSLVAKLLTQTMFRTMFHELRLSMEALAYSPKCPGFAKNIIYKVTFYM